MFQFILPIAMIFSFYSFSNALKADDIIISSKIKEPIQELLIKDFELLNQIEFTHKLDPLFLHTLNIKDQKNFNLDEWIKKRVNYIVEEEYLSKTNFYIFKNIKIIDSNVSYPNGNLTPYSYDPRAMNSVFSSSEEKAPVTIMNNLGASLYVSGKFKKIKYQVKIPQKGINKNILVPIESPRNGILQIGEALFSRKMTANTRNPKTVASRLMRLATFFHEARHSDGNGRSLSFGHSICPRGHDYEGRLACDESLNGSYMLGGLLLKEFIKYCEDECTISEKQSLNAMVLENFERVIRFQPDGHPARHWDPTPEKL